jgi:hypothetical protein
MTKAILWFAATGGLAVPVAFTALGALVRRLAPDSVAALGLLHEVQLPLWPMSRLILDDPAGRHWLYLPLAAILSNALLYAAVGALAAGRRSAPAAPALAIGIVVAGILGFGTGVAGSALAAVLALAGVAFGSHRLRRPPPAPEARRGPLPDE